MVVYIYKDDVSTLLYLYSVLILMQIQGLNVSQAPRQIAVLFP